MLDKLNEFTGSHGELERGKGLVTGTIALSLGILCFLGVLAFHFPQYLTTPELRKSYNVDVMRWVLLIALVVSGGLALVNILFNRSRWLSSCAFLLVAGALLAWFGVPPKDRHDLASTRPPEYHCNTAAPPVAASSAD